MKKLNLDETWKLCLSMWRWIAKQKKEGSLEKVWRLKEHWAVKHGYREFEIDEDCFFCEYILSHKTNTGCLKCPGAQIDKEFSCENKEHSYDKKPIAFYNKLVSLNRKRLAGKRK